MRKKNRELFSYFFNQVNLLNQGNQGSDSQTFLFFLSNKVPGDIS